MAFDIQMIKKVYERMPERVNKAREILGRPLTLTEKILYAHLWEELPSQAFVRGKDYVDFAPDRLSGCHSTDGTPSVYARRKVQGSGTYYSAL